MKHFTNLVALAPTGYGESYQSHSQSAVESLTSLFH